MICVVYNFIRPPKCVNVIQKELQYVFFSQVEGNFFFLWWRVKLQVLAVFLWFLVCSFALKGTLSSFLYFYITSALSFIPESILLAQQRPELSGLPVELYKTNTPTWTYTRRLSYLSLPAPHLSCSNSV